MKSINHRAPVQCSKSISIQAPAKKVWAVLSAIDHWADWQTDIRKPQVRGTLEPGTRFDWKTGGAKIHSTLHTVKENQQLGWTGKTWGLQAIHNWTLTGQEGKTLVRVEESMEGFLASLFKKAFNKKLAKGMQHWLELLKQESEKQAG